MDPQSFPTTPIKKKRFAIISDIFIWIKTHKKAAVVIISLIFLFVVFFSIIFQLFNNKFSLFSPPKQNQVPESKLVDGIPLTGSLKIQTDKDTYSVGETINLRVYADSKGRAIKAYDVLLKFDPEYLGRTDKVTPSLTQYDIYPNNERDLISVSGVQKEEISDDLFFNNTALFLYHFKVKKAGRTQINLVQAVNSTNESNLLDKESKDLLSHIYGKEIETK